MIVSSRFYITIAALATGLLAVSGVGATGGPFNGSADFYCDAVVVSYDVVGVGGALYFQVTDSANDPVGPAENVPSAAGSYTEVLEVDPEQPEGTSLKVRFSFDGVNYSDLFGNGIVTGDCSGEYSKGSGGGRKKPPPPPYELMGWVGARARMFVVADANGPDNPALVIYRVNEAGVGSFLFYISKQELGELPENPDEPLVIYSSDDSKIVFYKLPTGEYQINVGPDAEGKTHVVGFTDVPPTNIYSYTFSSLAYYLSPLWRSGRTLTTLS